MQCNNVSFVSNEDHFFWQTKHFLEIPQLEDSIIQAPKLYFTYRLKLATCIHTLRNSFICMVLKARAYLLPVRAGQRNQNNQPKQPKNEPKTGIFLHYMLKNSTY